MKLKNIKEADGFLETVNKCKSAVWLESPDGDKINLKSKLAQYIAIGKLVEEGSDLDLYCSSAEDRNRFYKYFSQFPDVNGNKEDVICS